MAKLSGLGGRLYSGETSFNIVENRKRWYSVSAIFIIVSFIPTLLGDRPDSGCPDAKNFQRARTVTIGLVKRKTIKRSIKVVRPSVNAKPRTPPTAKK